MRIGSYGLIYVVITMGIAFGQRTPTDKPAIATVCEVLGNVNRYADTTAVVVGRLERSVSLIDHYEFLSQDGCETPPSRKRGPWKIQVWTTTEEGMPKPPRNGPKLTEAAIAAKLSLVRKTTNLGSHEEPRFKADGHSMTYSHTAKVPNDWATVYGRIVRVHDGDEIHLIILAEPDEVRRVDINGTILPNEP